MKHQLQHNMVVKETTVEERKAIHKACNKAGIECEPIDTFLSIEAWPWICIKNDDCQWCLWSVIDTPLEEDTYISVEEFLLRAKGEWVTPQTPSPAHVQYPLEEQ